MNLNNNPTPSQLAALLVGEDDEAAHHVLWVRRDGEVIITALPDGITRADFAGRSDLQFRYETMIAGSGYVGAEAAASETYVNNRFSTLVKDWRAGRSGYLD